MSGNRFPEGIKETNMRKRLLALALCLVMALTLLPAATAESGKTAAEGDREIPARSGDKALPKDAGEKSYSGVALYEGVNDFAITSAGDTLYRPFTPSESGVYRIFSSGDEDTMGYLTDASGNEIAENDDGGASLNFEIKQELTAGVTYRIGARYYSNSSTGTIKVTITHYAENACGNSLYWEYDPSWRELTISGSGEMWDFEQGEAPWSYLSDEIAYVSLQNGVTRIGDYAFADLTMIDEIMLPGSVRQIGYAAFARCYGLENVGVPQTLETIGNFAFFYDTALTMFHVPATVSYIGSASFLSCVSMAPDAFTVDEGNLCYEVIDGVLYTKDGKVLVMYLTSKPQTAFTVPAGVETIYSLAFRNAELHSVTLSAGVTSVQSYAFEWCQNLQSITIAATVEYIDRGASVYCGALSDVFYLGSLETRESTLTIDNYYNYNDALLNATWHYQEDTDFDGTIEWNKNDLKFKGKTPYVVYSGSAFTPRFTVLDANGGVVDPSNYAYEYRENVNAGTAYVIVTFRNAYAGTARAWFKIYLPATTAMSVENVENGIYMQWNAVEGAAGYVIYRWAWSSTTTGWTSFERWNNTPDLNWTDTTVYAGSRYQYGVKAYFARRTDPVSGAQIGGNVGDNYNLGEVGPLKTTVRITTRRLKSLKAGSKQITASWEGSSKFTGYEVQSATNAAFTQDAKTTKIGNPKTYSTTLKSLKNGTEYYVRVRSYHVFEGMTYYGQWSNVLSVKPGSGQTVSYVGDPTYRALLVGESDYSAAQASDRASGVYDANAMAGVLEGLTNRFDTRVLTNAGKNQIINAIRSAYADTNDNSVSVFFFSGHGASDVYGRGGLYVTDDQTLTYKELAAELNTNVKGRVIVILSCCYSGSSINKSAEDDPTREIIEAFAGFSLDPEAGAKTGDLANSKFLVIAGAHSSEVGWSENHIGFDGNGCPQSALAAAVVMGMGCKYPNGAYKGSGMPADTSGDCAITLKELYTYAYDKVYGWTDGVSSGGYSGPQHVQYYGPDDAILFKR